MPTNDQPRSNAPGAIPHTAGTPTDKVIGRMLDKPDLALKLLDGLASCEAVRVAGGGDEVYLRNEHANVLWLREQARRLLGREG